MTLRARLTAAFLAVVLGPVVLGAVFVGLTVSAVSAERSTERLDSATAEVRVAVGAVCRRLRAAAEMAARLGEQGAEQVVRSGLATAVELTGEIAASAGAMPPRPWADCATTPVTASPAVLSVAASVETRDNAGRRIGMAAAIEPVDALFLARLTQTAGARAELVSGAVPSGASAGTGAGPSGAPDGRVAVDETTDRLVRRLDPAPGQPLTLVVSVPGRDGQGLYLVLVASVIIAGLVAISLAGWLARSTAQPLTELALAVERVADGDLDARVPVRSQDEVGRLGATFNRMTREMQGYVQALTSSRDQLRGQLGVLGDTLSSTHDLHRILQVILQTALAATGAQAGVVLLVDPSGAVLVGQCGEGLPDVGDLRLRLGEGLLGSVAATGEPKRGRIDRDGPALAPDEPRCRTYVAVPFAGPGGGVGLEAFGESGAGLPAAQGVLALYDRHGFDEFDDSDLVTLRTFAGQAAIALDNVRVHEEVQRLSLTDSLTGLYNYRYLREALRREIERASRFGRTLAVLALDLDRFKDINDTYGHAAGDAVLAEFACRLRAEIREVDFAFRQGGEEFVILLPETDADGGVVVAQRLGAAVRRAPVLVMSSAGTVEPRRVPVTVSIGVAVFPEHGATGPAVLEVADDALYQAKAEGRDTYRVASPRPAPVPVTAPAPAPAPASGAGAVDPATVEPSLGASQGPKPPRQSRGG